MPEALIELQLDDDVRHDIKRILIQRLRDAISGASVRDVELGELDRQLEGRLLPRGPERWPGSCLLNDPMSREKHIELLALLTQAQRQDPKWQVIEIDPNDADNASLQEAWLTNKASEYQLNNWLYNICYNVLRDPCAILFVGWKQSVRMVRKRMYRDAEFPHLPAVEDHQREEDREYEETLVQHPAIDYQGCELRTPDLADFYPYPADSQGQWDLKAMQGIGERMFLTEDQLLDGVEDYGYDPDEVEDLIRRGPTHNLKGDRLRDYKNQYDGTDGYLQAREDGFYECFLWFGKCPRLQQIDEESRIPEQYLHDDLMCMICPDADIVFQMDLSPYPDRPYISFSMLGRPNRFLGIGAMQLLATLQEEATANLQATIDGMNLEMTPALIVPPEYAQKYNTNEIFPGGLIIEEVMNSIRPLQWGGKAAMGLELGAALDDRASSLTAAQGWGQVNAKRPLVAEMQQVGSAVDAKFGLFLYGIGMSMEALAARIVALHLHFEGEGLNDSFTYQGQKKEVTAQNMRGRYRYVPTATSTTVTIESRMRITQQKIALQQGYIAAMLQVPPAFQPLVWHGVRQAFLDLGERQPEAWIGKEPVPPDPAAAGQAVPPFLQALIAQGVPPQVIQTAMAATQGLNQPGAGSGGALQQ